jgi:hypothetical protein
LPPKGFQTNNIQSLGYNEEKDDKENEEGRRVK